MTMRILLVEDDPVLGAVLRRGLQEDGYAVDLATSVADGRDHLAINEYDAAVLDLGLPDGDGSVLCRWVRERQLPTAVLILTARDSLSDKVAGLDGGADDYLIKPFDYPELAARVRAVMRRPRNTVPTVLQAGDIRLDPATHTVWRGAIVLPLTAREFALLHHLMLHAGAVVTRTELLEHVWDAHYEGTSNVVDVHIANLRRKLDLPGSPAPLETVRGVGFRLGMTS
ncbi:unannotated protein [freshwater metagenome]|jgi:two-component system OmpR family response regulator|uniref:Unannotated protein n=1 Tax=freshwater metagenome TaxID=449393 RepID=A0A6J7EVL2_9ZZZZ